jgi:hypothetical protein
MITVILLAEKFAIPMDNSIEPSMLIQLMRWHTLASLIATLY